MGTNYYKVKPLDETLKNRLIKAIVEGKFEVESPSTISFTDIDELLKTRIHIGKRSCGWKFLFDHNDWKYFKRTQHALEEWINNPNSGKIVDEYGEEYTPEQFWEEEVSPTYTEDNWDGSSYLKQHPREATYYDKDMDFYLGKYRVATSTDFS